MSRALALVVLLVACDQPKLVGTTTTPSSTSSAPMTGKPMDPHISMATLSTEVEFALGKGGVPATLTIPKDDGPWPAVVLMAGSGPTDRNWNNPLLAARNGSGKLLAEALAKHGMVVLRFDKAGTGKNPGPPLADLTLDTYRDEGLAALAYLRSRPDVRADRVFLAGHSEGGIHATRTALADGKVAGVIYLSAAGRPMVDIVLDQLESQLRNPAAGLSEADAKAEVTSLRAAFADFAAGKPVDPTKASKLVPIQQLVAAIVNPATEKLSRALLAFDTAAEIAKLTVPVFIFGGGKDVQVDPELDGRRLERALHDGKHDVRFYVGRDADHVLKHETKTQAELRANLVEVQANYNAEGRSLDEPTLKALVDWLAAKSR